MRNLEELRARAARAWKTWNDLIAPIMNTLLFLTFLVGIFAIGVALVQFRLTQTQTNAQLEQVEMMRQQLEDRPQVIYSYSVGLSRIDSRLVLVGNLRL